MARRLTESEKQQIVSDFTNGKSIDDLSLIFKFSKLTITRNLKKKLGEKKFKEFFEKNKLLTLNTNEDISSLDTNQSYFKNDKEVFEEQYFNDSAFTEVTPLNFEFDSSNQKDLSSIPIAEVEFPKTVFMIVNNKIELEIKYLKDYPEWQFLSQQELDKKTIEIHFDIKSAKRFCNKEQKVLKVPNTEVFKIVAPLLRSRGISRIVSPEKLIAL